MTESTLAVMYATISMVAIIIAVLYLAVQIRYGGGMVKYYKERGVGSKGFRHFVEGVFFIVIMTWVLTPVATVLCHNFWLDNHH